MAATSRHATSTSWGDISVIDKVGVEYTPLKDLSPARLPSTLCLAYWSLFDGNDNILLWHEEGRKTFLQGRCPKVGLTEACPQREIEVLRGQRVVQVEFSFQGAVYILVEDGTLYSAGDPSDGQLGRPDNLVPSNHFGAVPIAQPVKQIAVRWKHVLAMTEDRVFAFGLNNVGQLGIPGGGFSQEPRELYAGADLAAPQQVACGGNHSAILTAGGQVFTCGNSGSTGQGGSDGTHTMGEVRGLRGHHVQQVGSTVNCAYALSGGVLYGWGYNEDGQMGVGHKSEETWITQPAVIDCGGRQITSFRCEAGLVLALSATGDGLYWGWRRDGVIIQSPQLVTGRLHPREVFSEGWNSGGLVFPDTEENHHHLFRIDVRRLQDIVVALQCAVDATVDARESAETRLQKAEAEIKTTVDALESAETRLQKAESEIKAAVDARETAETRLQKSEAEITKIQGLLEKTIQTASEAGLGRVSQTEEIGELRRKIFGIQMTQDASAQQDLERENVFSGAIRLLEQGRLEQAEELSELRRRIAGIQLAPDAASGRAMQQQHVSAQQDVHGEYSARIAEFEREIHQLRMEKQEQLSQNAELERENSELRMEKREQLSQNAELERENSELRMEKREQLSQNAELERENSELRMEKREQLSQFRSATLDYRELLLQYNTHMESCGTTPLRGTTSDEQTRRGRERRRGAANSLSGSQRRN